MRGVGRFVPLVVLVASIAFVLLGVIWHFQRSLIYFPFGEVPSPPSVGLGDAEELTIPTADGEQLRAWFVPASTSAATVVVFNGNAGNRAYRAELAHGLR